MCLYYKWVDHEESVIWVSMLWLVAGVLFPLSDDSPLITSH
jgi:hypothetical protein